MTMLSKLNGIAARIGIAIVLAIILGFVAAIGIGELFSYRDYGQNVSRVVVSKSNFGIINPRRNGAMLSGRIVLIMRSVASAPRSEQQKIVAAMRDPEMQVALDDSARPLAEGGGDEWLQQLIQMQLDMASPPIPFSVRRLLVNGDEEAIVEAALPNGRRLTFTIPNYTLEKRHGVLLFFISLVVIAALVSVWTARRLAKPIREFAGAAERLGVDLTAPPLAVRGPQELRVTIEAVNRMQRRLQRFLEDRTQMLAAISHDLRAPLARLRLRAELVADGEQQRKMFDDLEAMNVMIDSTLAFARDESRQEPRRLVDLGVLVGDVCEDVADAGGEVSYAGRRGIDVSCRPTLIRRAVANLVDNAVKYGGNARVKIDRDTDRVVIVVDDDGPGIPAEEQEKVFAPFYRREAARDPSKAGVGLGLSIARTVAREHGGDVTLKNRDSGGLSALIELPA